MAKKFQQIGVSEQDDEQDFELETEDADVQPAETSGGAPPKETERGARPPSGGDRGGRPSRTAPATHGFIARTMQYIRDTRAEMRRVSWPSAKEVQNTTIITLIAVIFFALYLFGIDRVWAYLIEHLRTLLGG